MVAQLILANIVAVLAIAGLVYGLWNLYLYLRNRLAHRRIRKFLEEQERKRRAFYDQRHNKPWINRHGRLHSSIR